MFVFQGEGKVSDFQGSFSEWLEMEREAKAEAAAAAKGGGGGGDSKAAAAAASPAADKPKRKGMSKNERKELQGMEKAIEALQKQVAEYEAKLSNEVRSCLTWCVSARVFWRVSSTT